MLLMASSDPKWRGLSQEVAFKMVLDGLKVCTYGEEDSQELVVYVKALGVLEFLSAQAKLWTQSEHAMVACSGI